MRVQNINSNNYSKRQAFQANVHSIVNIPCLCETSKSEIVGAFIESSIKKGFVKTENIKGVFVEVKDKVLDMLLLDEKVSKAIADKSDVVTIKQLQTAQETVQMPLQVRQEDICPLQNGTGVLIIGLQ